MYCEEMFHNWHVCGQYVNGADKISHITANKAETMKKRPMQCNCLKNIAILLPPH